jgi:hypothetical protein
MIQILIFVFSLASFAALDLQYGLQGRTLPGIGAELYAESGYNQLLWGKKEGPKDVMYGLVRPNVGVSSSAVINSLKTELELFPISPIGIAVGRQYIHSNFNFPFLDCDNLNCTGRFQRDYVEGKMVLGYKGWVVLMNYRTDLLQAPNDNYPTADWRHVIVGNPGQDVEIERKLLLGKIFDNKLAGVLLEKVQFQGSREFKESFAAVYQFRMQDTAYMVGAGSFQSSQQPLGFIMYFRVHHVSLPSLKLF